MLNKKSFLLYTLMLSGCNNLVKNNMNPEQNPPSTSDHDISSHSNKINKDKIEILYKAIQNLLSVNKENIALSEINIENMCAHEQAQECLKNIISTMSSLIKLINSTRNVMGSTSDHPLVILLNNMEIAIKTFQSVLSRFQKLNDQSIEEYEKLVAHRLDFYKDILKENQNLNSEFITRQNIDQALSNVASSFKISIQDLGIRIQQAHEIRAKYSAANFHIIMMVYIANSFVDILLPNVQSIYNENRGHLEESNYDPQRDVFISSVQNMINPYIYYITSIDNFVKYNLGSYDRENLYENMRNIMMTIHNSTSNTTLSVPSGSVAVPYDNLDYRPSSVISYNIVDRKNWTENEITCFVLY